MSGTSQKGRVRRRLIAMVWMVFGSAAVFGLVMVMNLGGAKPPEKDKRQSVAFNVQRVEKKKPKMKVQRKVVKRRASRKVDRAPLPKISGGLGGMSFGIPEFDASAVGNLTGGLLGDMGDLVMTEDAVDNPPRVRGRASLLYPERARRKGVEGYVTLSLLVDERGQVQRVKVLEASPGGVFEDAALQSVRDWRFDPASYQGRNVRVWVQQTIRFDLT